MLTHKSSTMRNQNEVYHWEILLRFLVICYDSISWLEIKMDPFKVILS